MKLKKPTQKTITKQLINVALVTAGISVSRGLKAIVPQKQQQYAQLMVATLGVIGASTSTDKMIQLGGVSVAALQITDYLSKLAKDNLKLDKDTKLNQIIKATLGMNGSNGLNGNKEIAYISDWQPSQKKEIQTIDAEFSIVN